MDFGSVMEIFLGFARQSGRRDCLLSNNVGIVLYLVLGR